MKYLVSKRNAWLGPVSFQVTDEGDNKVFDITTGPSWRWTLQDTSGNPLTILRRKTSFWRGTWEIERVGVIATIGRIRGRGKLRHEILLATGERLTATSSPTGKKCEVRGAEGQPFCRLELRWFSNTRDVEVEEGAELVLAFSLIAWCIQRQEIISSVA